MKNKKELILLNDAKEIIKNYGKQAIDDGLKNLDVVDGIVDIVILIEKIPTIDAVEVIHAKWENIQNGYGCCSNCHRMDDVDRLATHCRYCGAKMDASDK